MDINPRHMYVPPREKFPGNGILNHGIVLLILILGLVQAYLVFSMEKRIDRIEMELKELQRTTASILTRELRRSKDEQEQRTRQIPP
jgi:hypothetical protein